MGKYIDGIQGIGSIALYPLERVVDLLGEVNGKIDTNDVYLLLEPLLNRADRILNTLEDAVDEKFVVTYDMQKDEITKVDIVEKERWIPGK